MSVQPTRSATQGARSASLALNSRLALRPAELAEALGISERLVRELTPKLPHIREGRVLLYPVEAVRRWLDERARESVLPLGPAPAAPVRRRRGASSSSCRETSAERVSREIVDEIRESMKTP